jgi:aspartyl aminopeptidase
MEHPNVWKDLDADRLAELDMVCGGYKDFISANKTERECAESVVDMARSQGYVALEELVRQGEPLAAGTKVYASNRGKEVALFHIGAQPLSRGMNILGAHIDSPRLDVKQNPLEEKDGLAYLDTHYYGGIKAYQWLALPLAIRGVVVKKDGTKIYVSVGDAEGDPVFCVTDLLPHLGAEQMKKPASEVIDKELLDVLVGNRPMVVEDGDEAAEKDPVKRTILAGLKDIYGIDEEDFLSAELEVVPAGAARDCGLDRSMVMGYGQDDRVCAYTSLLALLSHDSVARTACCLLTDKEEIGSAGATGAQSTFFEDAVAELLALSGDDSHVALRRCLRNSDMLSSDVSAAYDPSFASVFERKNAAFLGNGICFNKYTGARGKSGSNDADAEFVARVREVMDRNQVRFQTCELGKVDAGGGGTIALYFARYGMNVIDAGVAVLNMHAPFEITSKADIYEAWRAYKAFLTIA